MQERINPKEEILHKIINEIFQLEELNIEESRRKQISDFVISTVNGDIPLHYLAIGANLESTGKPGIIVFVITNLRLIKIDINNKEIESKSFPLNTITGINRKIKDDQIEFSVFFQNGAFGLRYSLEDKNITHFFQKIEHQGEISG